MSQARIPPIQCLLMDTLPPIRLRRFPPGGGHQWPGEAGSTAAA